MAMAPCLASHSKSAHRRDKALNRQSDKTLAALRRGGMVTRGVSRDGGLDVCRDVGLDICRDAELDVYHDGGLDAFHGRIDGTPGASSDAL